MAMGPVLSKRCNSQGKGSADCTACGEDASRHSQVLEQTDVHRDGLGTIEPPPLTFGIEFFRKASLGN